jgi:O-acetyl-ADP-ribose deacetylase (regulator of RNase III)
MIVERARGLAIEALDQGWSGPPFDPIQLADRLGLAIAPNADIRDARTVPAGRQGVRIEFNPNRPRGRMRYSIAHEIAHTLFPDCADRVRNRARHADMEGDEWQLEALCNIAAAELLMPAGEMTEVAEHATEIDRLLEHQVRFDVSTEALFIRAARLTAQPCAMFCASRITQGSLAGRYQLDYVIASHSWTGAGQVSRRSVLPGSTVVAHCTTIGFTAKGEEDWSDAVSWAATLHVECVGIPPYPESQHPRVVGLLRPSRQSQDTRATSRLVFVRGDATVPRGEGKKFIVQVVNDKTANWGGGGFAVSVRRKFPQVQEDFLRWAEEKHDALRLGAVHFARPADDIWVASVVAQKGYGPSARPRVRYSALHDGLQQVARRARTESANIHMPRIGCGLAGGSWDVVEELVRTTMLDAGLRVTVYDQPDLRASRSRKSSAQQQGLAF